MKKEEKNSRRIKSADIPSADISEVSISNLLSIKVRRARKTKTKEVFVTKVAEGVAVTTFLQQVQMLISSRKTKKMRKTSLKLSAIFIIRKDITNTNIPRI